MAFSAAVVAGSCVGGFLFAFIICTPVIWYLFRHRAEPPLTLRMRLFDLRDEFDQVLNVQYKFKMDDGHPSRMLRAFHERLSGFVETFFSRPQAEPLSPDHVAMMKSLAGFSHEDWSHLHSDELSYQRRKSALVQFVCRVVHRRIIPNGDLSITLLPKDILSTYQRILSKMAPTVWSYDFVANDETVKDNARRTRELLLQYWRTLTTCWCSETHFHLENFPDMARTDCMKVERQPGRDKFTLPDDDPRLPQIQATEDVLMEAILPLYNPTFPEGKSHEVMRSRLRILLVIAADLAIMSFAETQPIELFWPPEQRRPGRDPKEDDGYLECFGIRQRVSIPGLESDGQGGIPIGQVASTRLLTCPRWSDSEHFEDGGEYSGIMNSRWRREKAAASPDGKPDQATEDEFERREKLRKEYQKQAVYRDVPGWDGDESWFRFRERPTVGRPESDLTW